MARPSTKPSPDRTEARPQPRDVLVVDGLTAQYDTRRGAVRAVNDVSFEVQAGEVVGVVGESGCGKSATIRALLGLLPHPGRVVGGSATFAGTDLLRASQKQLRSLRGNDIGFVAQNPFGALNPVLSIRDQFHNVIRAHRGRVPRSEMDELAKSALVGVGISGPQRVLAGHAHELSGGMAQRVVIALALLLDPPLVIGDEPTTALDVTLQRQILDMVRARVLEAGRSMLLVTHDIGVVAQYCDRVVVMYAGRVIEKGTVAEVLGAPAHPYTRALLASVPRRGQRLATLPGRVPDLVDYPAGCPFSARCPDVHDRCWTENPAAVSLTAGDDRPRSVSCHLHAERDRDVVRTR